MKTISIFFILSMLSSCQPSQPQVNTKEQTVQVEEISIEQAVEPLPILNPEGTTVLTRFNPPAGFQRVGYAEQSYGYFLQNMPLKPHNSKVLLYDGRAKYRQDVHAAVLEVDVEKRDLQQCADAIMRLRAEYLWKQNNYEAIRFNFTNGFDAKYSKWRAGNRIAVSGNKVSWVKKYGETPSYKAFRQYLTMVFSYAGTLSLDKELPSKPLETLEVGDVFIQGGSPGHAIVVMDKAVNQEGEVVFLLAQSYMPAQDIHILINPLADEISPWYRLSSIQPDLFTPEWEFTKDDLKTF